MKLLNFFSKALSLSIAFFFVVSFFLAGCAGHSKVIKPSAQTNSLPTLTQQFNLQTQSDSVTQTVTIFYQGQRIEVLVGSNLVLKNGRRISLDRAIARHKGEVIFPSDFIEKALSLSTAQPTKPPEYVPGFFQEIIIDPGHGGKDPGAISRGGVKEKDVVLDIAQRVKENLEQKGIKVTMTRQSDEFVSLEERTQIASRSKADFYVSIHANSSRNKKVQGMEIYYPREMSASEKPEVQQQVNLSTMVGHLNAKKELPIVGDILRDMMHAVKYTESKEFGQTVIRQSSRAVDIPNRGCRTCRFFVVRNTLMPAVLIEVGYLTNSKEEGLLNSASYRQKIAEALAESIFNYAHDS